jgi:hypothetical protein
MRIVRQTEQGLGFRDGGRGSMLLGEAIHCVEAFDKPMKAAK